MTVAKESDLVLLIGPRGKRFIIRLEAGATLHTHMGVISHDAIIGKPMGRRLVSHLDKQFLVLEPHLSQGIRLHSAQDERPRWTTSD
jgi:tRNA (adenine57-N1/adenine58-N1)-methyltransferase